MIRKILHSGIVMQVLFLFSLTGIALIVHNPNPGDTYMSASLLSANGSSYVLAIAGGDNNNTEPAYGHLTSTYEEPPFLNPAEGPGGPVLVVSAPDNPFSRYTTEILRTEGLNYFAATNLSMLNPELLNGYDVVILGEIKVDERQVAMFTDWVNAGGTLISFKPSHLLHPLFGITGFENTLSDRYILAHTSSGPGYGIVNQTIQYHGTANLYEIRDAESIAAIYSDASTPSGYPAVTTRNVGANGGKAIAFAYDLPRSIVYTRQGNPAWAGQKRDGAIDPIRSDDMFFPNWIDLHKVAIPQADEQQRLLANIILQSNLHRKPLPRFWYLPRDLKAAIVMTGDDHATNETAGRFSQYVKLGPNTPEDVADWRAIRATSYIYPHTKMTNAEAAIFQSLGFEIALHPTTNCSNYTGHTLENTLNAQLTEFANKFPDIAAPVTNRVHCLVWSDWATMPKVESAKGIRLNTSYYYWPASWIQNRPGMFTGSGMPMRFADKDGSLIDNYQLTTQMTDESGIDITNFCNRVLDKALGAEGYYGVFCANMHTDTAIHKGSNAIIASATARQVPVISAKQLLTWLDARNNSFFSNIQWSNNRLSFAIMARQSARNLRAMLPLYSEGGKLKSIALNGKPVAFVVQTIKGMQYAFFTAVPGNHHYTADYNAEETPVDVTAALSAATQ